MSERHFFSQPWLGFYLSDRCNPNLPNPSWSAHPLTFTDACFEAVSGLTTTGATALKNLDAAPRGLLLWRAMLQWMGGIGIVIVAMTILPILKIGGMQLFRRIRTV